MSHFSYFIRLCQAPDNLVEVPGFTLGPSVADGRPQAAEICIPPGYLQWFDFVGLKDEVAQDTGLALSQAVARLGTYRSRDYWRPTEGNVGMVCDLLLQWSGEHPHATWQIDPA